MSETVLDTLGEPTFLQLTADQLFVDTKVQRATDEERAQAMASDFRMPGVRTLVVSDRGPNAPKNKRYHVVDGGHRRLALIYSGHGSTPVNCEVYTGLTVRQEAELFDLLNEAKKVDYLTKFRVRIIQQDPDAVALNQILKSRGLRIGAVSTRHIFAAVQTLEWVYFKHQSMHPEADDLNSAAIALALVQETWPDCPKAFERAIVKGFGLFVLRYFNEFEPEALIKKVRTEFGTAVDSAGPIALLAKAKGRAAVSVKTNQAEGVFELLVATYNSRRGARALPTVVSPATSVKFMEA